MTQLLVINGSYRENGAIDQAVNLAVEAASESGADIEVIHLRDFPIEFCTNCRHCTQLPGDSPGECVHPDNMPLLIKKIEASDGFILASPTNFATVTAVFKRFMERLVGYAYWPWEADGPKLRRSRPLKKAILISSGAAPGLMGRLYYTTLQQLKMTAETIGARPVGSVFIGHMARHEHPVLTKKVQRRVRAKVKKLL